MNRDVLGLLCADVVVEHTGELNALPTSDAVSVLSLLGPGEEENLVLILRGFVTSVFATVVGIVTEPSCSSVTEITIFTALSFTVFSWSLLIWPKLTGVLNPADSPITSTSLSGKISTITGLLA